MRMTHEQLPQRRSVLPRMSATDESSALDAAVAGIRRSSSATCLSAPFSRRQAARLQRRRRAGAIGTRLLLKFEWQQLHGLGRLRRLSHHQQLSRLVAHPLLCRRSQQPASRPCSQPARGGQQRHELRKTRCMRSQRLGCGGTAAGSPVRVAAHSMKSTSMCSRHALGG